MEMEAVTSPSPGGQAPTRAAAPERGARHPPAAPGPQPSRLGRKWILLAGVLGNQRLNVWSLYGGIRPTAAVPAHTSAAGAFASSSKTGPQSNQGPQGQH